MNTAVHIAKFIGKALLFIVASPFVLIWFLIRRGNFRRSMIRELKRTGMPKDCARDIAREMRIGGFMPFRRT